MFKVKLDENAGAAYLEASDALVRILDGEGNYKNYRAYVVNLHSALELFFKKKLFDYNEFMLFSFSDYKKLIEKYEKAFKANQTVFEYIESSNSNMPYTVTFNDAIDRLAYLYRDSEFTIDYITKLKSLNSLRNNITHFELSIEDDQFVLLKATSKNHKKQCQGNQSKDAPGFPRFQRSYAQVLRLLGSRISAFFSAPLKKGTLILGLVSVAATSHTGTCYKPDWSARC